MDTNNQSNNSGSKKTVAIVIALALVAVGAAASFMYWGGAGDELEPVVVPSSDVITDESTEDPILADSVIDDTSSSDTDTTEDSASVHDSTASNDVTADIGTPPAASDITILTPDGFDDIVQPGLIPTAGEYSYELAATDDNVECTMAIPAASLSALGQADVEFVNDGYQAIVNIDGSTLNFDAINAFDTLYYQTASESFPFRGPEDEQLFGEVKFMMQPQTQTEIDFWIMWDNQLDCAGAYPAKMFLQ